METLRKNGQSLKDAVNAEEASLLLHSVESQDLGGAMRGGGDFVVLGESGI